MFDAAVKRFLPRLGYDLPDQAFFLQAKMLTKYTPDIAKLEQYEWQLYFAHDETQPRHTKFRLLGDDLTFQAPAFTQKRYNYWSPPGPWDSPVALEAPTYKKSVCNYPDSAIIKGQIFAIRPQQFISLDTYRENGVQFHRERIRLLVPYRQIKFVKDISKLDPDIEFVEGYIGRTKEKLCIVRAWMYVGIPQYWDKLISAFDWGAIQTFESKNRPWCRTYYQFRMPIPKS